MKKIMAILNYRNLALFACAIVFFSFFCPIFSASEELEAAFVVTIKLINLPEFSGFGGIVVALPFLMIALLLCERLSVTSQTIVWFILNLASAYAIPTALFAARQHLFINVGQIITRQSGLSLSLPLLIVSSVLTLFAIQDCSLNVKVDNTQS